jgi:hypothetical protein
VYFGFTSGDKRVTAGRGISQRPLGRPTDKWYTDGDANANANANANVRLKAAVEVGNGSDRWALQVYRGSSEQRNLYLVRSRCHEQKAIAAGVRKEHGKSCNVQLLHLKITYKHLDQGSSLWVRCVFHLDRFALALSLESALPRLLTHHTRSCGLFLGSRTSIFRSR